MVFLLTTSDSIDGRCKRIGCEVLIGIHVHLLVVGSCTLVLRCINDCVLVVVSRRLPQQLMWKESLAFQKALD